MSTEVARAHVILDAKTAGLQSGLAQADARMRSFASGADAAAARTSGAWSRMSTVMRRGVLTVGVAAAAGFGSAIKVAASFEQQLSELQAVSGAGAKDMGRMKTAALDLGASTKFSAREVAAAQVELAKAGLDVSQVLGGSLKGSLALAAAGNIDLEQAAATVVNTMGQFGLGASSAGRIADGLAEAANATTADVGDMAMALENVGPSAKAAGLSFDQTLVALEMLARSGTKGAEAGTNLRSMFNALANPTEKSAERMRELGVNVFDSAGRMKDIDVIAGDLGKAFRGLTNEQRLQAAATVAGQYGQKALLSIMEGGPKAARDYERGLQRTGQAGRVAAVMNDNLAGKTEQLTGAIETMQIKLGSALIPLLADGAVATAEFIDAVAESSEFEAFADGAADALADFAQIAGRVWDEAAPRLREMGSAGEQAFDAISTFAAGAAPTLETTATVLLDVADAAITVTGATASAVGSLAGIPGVSQSATAGLIGLAAAWATYKTAAMGATAVGGVNSILAVAASLRAVPAAANQAAAAQAALAAVTQRSQLIAATSAMRYQQTFTSAVDATTKAQFLAATSARTFGTTFAAQTTKAATSGSRLGSVMTAVGQRFPTLAAGAAALVSPMGLAALGVGAVAGGLIALAANTDTTSERIAAGFQKVTAAIQGADAAMRGLTSASQSLTDARIQEDAALLAKQRAQQRVNQLEAQGKKGTLEYKEAVNQLEATTNNHNKSRAQTAKAAVSVRNETLRTAKAFAQFANDLNAQKLTLSDQVEMLGNLGKSLNISDSAVKKYADQWVDLDKKGASAAEKLNVVRSMVRGAADELRKAGKTKMADELDKIGKVDTRGLIEFGDRVAELEAKGVKPIAAMRKALSEIKPPKTLKLDAKDQVTPKADRARRAIQRIRQGTPAPVNLDDQITPLIPGIQARIDGIKGKTVSVTVRPNFPEGSPRVYEIPELMRDPAFKNRTFTVTARPQGTGELETMGRKAAAIATGNVTALRRHFGGGSIGALRDNVASAGGLLIRADLDIANLPEVLAEAREVGVTIGGTAGAALNKERAALARTVGTANEVARRIEQLRSLTDQLARAKSQQQRAGKGKDNAQERREAAAAVKRIQQQIAAAQTAFRKLAGGDTAATALQKLNRQIAAQTGALGTRAADLRDRAEELRAAKDRAFDALRDTTLSSFDSETQQQLGLIASEYNDGFRVVAGAFELVPGIMRQAQERSEAALASVREAMDSEMRAFDRTVKARTKSLEATFAAESKALEDRARGLTRSERLLADLRASRAATDIDRSVQESEAALREAYERGMPKAEIVKRQRDVEQSRYAEQEASLEKTAAAEREAFDAQLEREREALSAAHEVRREAFDDQIELERKAIQDRHDVQTRGMERAAEAERLYLQAQMDGRTSALEDQREAERRGLEAQLDQWRTHLDGIKSVVGGNHASVLAQVNQFSGQLEASGRKLGRSYADGLRQSFPELRRAADAAAGIIGSYLKLNSPAETGPLSTLDKWWEPFGDTLVSGMGTRQVDDLLAHYADPARGGSSQGGVFAPAATINVTVADRTFAGMSRDQAREVASQLAPELSRLVGMRTATR